MVAFKKAVRTQKKLRAALLGPAGSGKTRTALEMAKGMGGKIALIDSEHGSASMYAHLIDFDSVELTSFAPSRYIDAIGEAEAAGYDVLVIDSLSHAWSGKDGILEFVDRTKKNNNSFNAWGDATPLHNQLVEKLLSCRMHLIVTMRTKMEHVQEKDERTGKTIVRKVGMQPVQRDGMEYEFDVICDIDQQHTLTVAKTRIDELDHLVIEKANGEFGAKIKRWLDGGAPLKIVHDETAEQKAAAALEQRKAQAFAWAMRYLDTIDGAKATDELVALMDAADIEGKCSRCGAAKGVACEGGKTHEERSFRPRLKALDAELVTGLCAYESRTFNLLAGADGAAATFEIGEDEKLALAKLEERRRVMKSAG